MLSNIAALTLGREQMEMYRRWVQDFGGRFDPQPAEVFS